MDMDHWSAAAARFDKAEKHLRDLNQLDINEHNARISAWEDYLNELARGFNKLFHGERKGTPASAVIRQIADDRKDDPLLNYLREARNVLEHGIAMVATQQGTARDLEPHEPRPALWMEIVSVDEDGNKTVHSAGPGDLQIMENLRFILVPLLVGGKSVPVPDIHFGKAVTDNSPIGIGAEGLIYARKKLDELKPFLPFKI